VEFVYLLWHNHRHNHLLIGVYRDQASAEAARERLCAKPGFAELPENFEISPYELDKDHWTEGFVMIS